MDEESENESRPPDTFSSLDVLASHLDDNGNPSAPSQDNGMVASTQTKI